MDAGGVRKEYFQVRMSVSIHVEINVKSHDFYHSDVHIQAYPIIVYSHECKYSSNWGRKVSILIASLIISLYLSLSLSLSLSLLDLFSLRHPPKVITKQLLDPDYGMFKYYPESRMLWFNRLVPKTKEKKTD